MRRCAQGYCPSGDHCHNQMFSRRQGAKLEKVSHIRPLITAYAACPDHTTCRSRQTCNTRWQIAPLLAVADISFNALARPAQRRAGAKGFGLFASEDIKAGHFVIQYVGEVLEEEEYMRRKVYYQHAGQRHYYFMNIGNGEVIDACRKVRLPRSLDVRVSCILEPLVPGHRASRQAPPVGGYSSLPGLHEWPAAGIA